jgi:potassium-dependent mechanosensitive channel
MKGAVDTARLGPLAPVLAALVLAAVAGVAAGAAGAAGQAVQAEQAGQAGQPWQAEPPGVFEVATRARMVVDSAARAESAIARLGATAGVATEIADAGRRQAELRALLSSMADTEFVRPERLSRLRDQALLEDGRLEALSARLMDRLAQVGEIRGRWLRYQQDWRSWRRTLADDAEFPQVRVELDEAIERIDQVVASASEAATTLLALQRGTEELRAEVDRIVTVVTTVRNARQRAIRERGEPILFSSEHRTELAAIDWEEWEPLATVAPEAYLSFARQNTGLLFFYLVLAGVLGFGASRLRWATEPDPWGGLLDRPWAIGLFGVVVLAMQRVTLAPPLWDVLLWALFAVTAVVLSRRLFATRALQWTVLLLGVFYPAFLFLEVLDLPASAFRIGLAVVAAAAVPVFAVLAGRHTAAAAAAEPPKPSRIWPLRIGAFMWGLVLLAVVTGYDALGRWILHSTLTTGALAFVVVVVFALAGSALPMLVSSADSNRLLRGTGLLFVRRLIWLFRAVVAVAVVLVLLDVWGVAPSPVATWQRIVATGITTGPLQITVGNVLIAAFLVYAALLLSGLFRSLVAQGVERKHGGDRGLSESVSRLVQYIIVTVGIIFGLAALGVELQNFAILAGALGIGVGFGLQNVVNNFASGLILLFERPVRVGDTVVVNDVWGTIQKIGLRSTVMVTFDQSEMIVPNADLVSEKVTNWTLSSPTARVIVPIGVAYGSPVQRVKEIMIAAALEMEDVLHEPPPEALFLDFGDNSLDFELRMWVNNIRRRLFVRSAVLTSIEQRFNDEGIEIPFPQRDLHLRSVSPELLGRLPKTTPTSTSEGDQREGPG